jgi:hypothetical protein
LSTQGSEARGPHRSLPAAHARQGPGCSAGLWAGWPLSCRPAWLADGEGQSMKDGHSPCRGARARARGLIQNAGEWPCKLASVSTNGGLHASKKHDDIEGMEMLQRMNGDYVHKSADCSPTSVTDMTAWDFVPRGALCLDSVAAALQGSSSSNYLGVGEAERVSLMGSQRHGGAGGLFSSIRGAHNTWQPHSESDASNTRQKHALSLALGKKRGGCEAEEEEKKVGEKRSERSGEGSSSTTTANESLMGVLIRRLQDEKHASSTFASMTRNAPSGYTGVRASAFALVTLNPAASGRLAPERHLEAPPRVPLHHPSTKEGVSGARAACRPGSHDASKSSSKPSTLTARRTESTLSVRQHECKNMEW